MEIPDLVRDALGDEEVQAGVNLGDEDAVCFTPTRTLVYRGEGLLSDEDVSAYPHDFERLAVSEGRRKTKFTMTYVDDKAEFAVPGDRTGAVLERLAEGTLQVGGVLDAGEGVTGVFRFSELTVVVTDHRMLKHIGEFTWDGDFEVFPFDDVTGLDFEDGSVATAVVLEVEGRPERIKAPNDQAALVRKTLEEALFAYHDVGSLAELNRVVAVDDEESADEDAEDEETASGRSGGLGLESGIDPLVGDDGGETQSETETTKSAGQGGSAASRQQSRERPAAGSDSTVASADASTVDVPEATGETVDREEFEAVRDQLAELTRTVEEQNKLLKQQQRTVKQLIEELRRGR